MSSKRLGKGIEALINSNKLNKTNSKVGTVKKIILSKIKPNPNQPRHNFNHDTLNELTKSIKEKGVITPITLRKIVDGYEIIAGERRWRAAKKARLKSIPAHVVNIKNNAEMMELALIENVQREDLNPIEEAEGYAILNSEYKMSHEDIAKSIGKKRVTISNSLRLLRLPIEIRKSIKGGYISAGHGRALLQLKTDKLIKSIFKKIIDESLSVRQVEAIVKKKSPNSKKKKIVLKEASYRAIENQLIEILGTKVKLKPSRIGGSIEIIYFSNEDLERIIDLVKSI